ncbi:type IV conjugative transfer system lipoprotein TraV [Vibrio sp. 10N.261.46.E12]|uniref:type IV conjugative transfer system lipoprotein TraV n=1 Tax=Vibrio TaxID=662 RepID=UPI000976C03C|nr:MULTISPECIES: type IV conjugative transfer system lipoprotein TraV [Vibrio]OMO35729.1 type IV conjugative transfer system protein TraV [Vibrio sp. 10N.261.45.E1]PMJ22889.1 type IV conjugative transfer system protein TraV [Vibrio sp. 10N.286.45.B6]PML87210.1 type IV conjugative transfer system protein TraV [Vibrio sp. 10N.261.49.E11]PMM38679.1 type IV conjugative transfer system protein TraV [Vibrio lentus]PMM67530.1 type IV conjugative transfer system protein TraV [Vibrio sp. 10N.261.46.F12
MTILMKGATLIFVFTLAGCAGFQNESSCTKVDGLASCSSLSDVHNMANNGTIAASEEGQITRGYQSGNDEGGTLTLAPRFGAVSAPRASSTPIRVPERTARMVVFPYIDEEGHYHDTASIDILISEPYWSKPAATVIRKQLEASQL